MAVLVTDPFLEEHLKLDRQASGADRYDEVWEGVYILTPMPNIEHQQVVLRLAAIFEEVVDRPGLGEVFAGVNLSDRDEGWEHNYRVPDIAVFLQGTVAEKCGTHWRGPADLLVEITSPDDRSREKIPFYDQLGVRELLLVERDTWTLELYQRQEGGLKKTGQATVAESESLVSAVVPLRFRLLSGMPRPQIEAPRTDADRRWLV
jgi:Uma2 family endonuclease